MNNTHTSTMTKRALFVIGLLCLCLSFNTQAFENSRSNSGDDDTILIESSSDTKFSYSTAIKSFSKHVLKFDIDSLLSGGKNCTDSVIRNFNDLSDRTKYRLNLKQDRLEVKLTLNF